MTPWDDLEVDSDGDEMLDWLWDLPDRYDVGIDDNPTAPGAVVDGAGRPGVRKHIRRPGEAMGAAAAPDAPAGWADDRPTEAVDLSEPLDHPEFGDEAMFAPVAARESRLSRYTTRELVTAAAVFLAVLAVAGIGYALFANKGTTRKPSNLAVGSATTTATTVAGVIATPGAAATSPTDTTTIPPDTTTTAPATDNGAAGAFAGFTTTTVRQCLVAGTCQAPPPNTAPNTAPTTAPTVPRTTTTAPRPSTTTTVPPATTTTPKPTTTTTSTTVASTTTTTVAATTTTT